MATSPPDVAFHFDPACPWTWVTSRWLTAVAEAEGFEVDWRPFSLKLHTGDAPDEHAHLLEASHRALRIVTKLREDHGAAAVAAFYTERGRRAFGEGDTDPDLADVLEAAGLDRSYAAAADDESLDDIIRKHLDDAHSAVDGTSGSPTLVVGDKGFFGPVLTAVPEDPSALWHGLMSVWNIPELSELKRGRPDEPTFPAA